MSTLQTLLSALLLVLSSFASVLSSPTATPVSMDQRSASVFNNGTVLGNLSATTSTLPSPGIEGNAATTQPPWAPFWMSLSTYLSSPSVYTLLDNSVYVNGFLIPDADPTTFLIFVDPSGTPDGFAKDATHVFFYKLIIPGADPNTFIPLFDDGYVLYAKDKNHVYYDDGVDNMSIVEGADPATFTALGQGYFKDKNHVYGKDGLIGGADPATSNPATFEPASFEPASP